MLMYIVSSKDRGLNFGYSFHPYQYCEYASSIGSGKSSAGLSEPLLHHNVITKFSCLESTHKYSKTCLLKQPLKKRQNKGLNGKW